MQTLLPSDLEESARATKALLRCRNVPDAAALIRMALAYAVSDLSLKDVAAWASALNVAQITGPGLFYRLREAENWLEHVLGRVLADQVPQAAGGWPVRAVDATVINGPGKKAVQWRAHVQIDPATGGFRAVELTDDSGGEKLSRHHFRAGEVSFGRPGLCHRSGIHAVRQAEAHVIVRFNPGNLRTCDGQRKRLYLAEKEAEIPAVGAVEYNIVIPVPPNPTKSHKIWSSAKAIAWIPARAIAARTRAGEVIWILTTLDAAQMPSYCGHGSVPIALADRTAFQETQIVAPSGYPSVPGRTDCQELDVGAIDCCRLGATPCAAFWPTFPLGLRIAIQFPNRILARIVLGLASA